MSCCCVSTKTTTVREIHNCLGSECECCQNNNDMNYLIDVEARPTTSIIVTLHYSNSALDYSTNISIGGKYDVWYLEDKCIKHIVGIVTDVTKIYSLEEYEEEENSTYIPEYKITFDASTEGNSKVVIIKANQIRKIKFYTKYSNEGTKLTEARSSGGNTIGKVNNIEIKNATIDKSGTDIVVTDGDVTNGDITDDSTTTDGIIDGKNPNGNHVYIVDSKVYGGTITAGKVISATMQGAVKFIDEGTVDPNNPDIIYNATISGNAEDVVIIDSVVTNGITDGKTGEIKEATLQNFIVSGGTVTGEDMITTSGTTVDNVTYNGITTGGVVTGGTAVGEFNGKPAYATGNITIIGGTVSGGTITGGVISGGTTENGVTVNGVVKGGTGTAGITIGGILYINNGMITYGRTSEVKFKDIIFPSAAVPPNTDTSDDDSKSKYSKPMEGLIVSNDPVRGVRSNIEEEDAKIVADIDKV